MPALETMNLSEYRENALAVLFDLYADYAAVPADVWQSAYWRIKDAKDEGAISRALHSCRDAL